jgi:hypothetical protein
MILILVLSTLSSGIDFVAAESILENSELIQKSKHYTVSLTEKMGISHDPKKQSVNSKHYNVSLYDKLSVTSDSQDQNFVLIKHDFDRKAIMERIIDRQSKFRIEELKLLQISLPLTLSYLEQNIFDDNLINIDLNLLSNQFNFELVSLVQNTFETEKTIPNSIKFDQNNIEFISEQIFDIDNPIFLIILIPFAGFVLIRYDNEQIKFYQIKQFFTFTFVIILVSSAAITPMSISSSYWGYAYAEIDNSTEIISQLENSKNILQENVTNISSADNFTKINFSQTIIPELFSTSNISDLLVTDSNISLSDILSFTLSKHTDSAGSNISDLLTPDSNISLSDILSFTLSKHTDSTGSNLSTSPTDSNISLSDILSFTLSKHTDSGGSNISGSTINSNISLSDSLTVIFTPGFSLEDATLSLSFDSLENGTSSGDVQINNASSLQLDGDHDFVHVNNTSTNNLRSLVLSAWC